MRLARYSPIHVEPDQDQQRDHHEERHVDAGQRLLQHPQLLVVLVRLRHLARLVRELARQVLARHHHAGHLAGRIADRRRDVHQIAAGGERIDPARRRGLAGADARRQRIGGRARPALRHRRRGDIHQRDHLTGWPGVAHGAIDLDHADALSRDFGRDDPLHARHVGGRQIDARSAIARCARPVR